MLIMLLSLMGFHLWGEPIHEWLGIAFLCIILLHNGLNTHWFRKMFLGEYPVFRIIQLAMNLVLILLLLCAIVSGLMLSRHALPNVPIHSATDLVRKIHMTSVHWGQVLIAIHLGMHWKNLAYITIVYVCHSIDACRVHLYCRIRRLCLCDARHVRLSSDSG